MLLGIRGGSAAAAATPRDPRARGERLRDREEGGLVKIDTVVAAQTNTNGRVPRAWAAKVVTERVGAQHAGNEKACTRERMTGISKRDMAAPPTGGTRREHRAREEDTSSKLGAGGETNRNVYPYEFSNPRILATLHLQKNEDLSALSAYQAYAMGSRRFLFSLVLTPVARWGGHERRWALRRKENAEAEGGGKREEDMDRGREEINEQAQITRSSGFLRLPATLTSKFHPSASTSVAQAEFRASASSLSPGPRVPDNNSRIDPWTLHSPPILIFILALVQATIRRRPVGCIPVAGFASPPFRTYPPPPETSS